MYHNYVKKEGSIRFIRETRVLTDRIINRMAVYEQILRGAKGSFHTASNVTREEWKNYIEQLQLQENFPGFSAIGFAEHIKPSEKASHLKKFRVEGFPDYMIKPPGQREEYTSIVYIEPFNEANHRAFGYDMFSEPVRRAAMKRARDTGLNTLSGRVDLVQNDKNTAKPAFLIYLPVYAPHGTPLTVAVPDSIDERRRLLRGYVFAPYYVDRVMKDILPDSLVNVTFKIFDNGTEDKNTLLYDGAGELNTAEADNKIEYQGDFTATSTITTAGRKWLLRFNSTAAFDNNLDSRMPNIILIAGLFIIGIMLLTTRNRALTIAKEMTAELRNSQESMADRVDERTVELRMANLNLEEARKEAEDANRAKSDFLAVMSHEIRTPMNGVVGMIEVLSHSQLSESQSDAIKTIKESGFSLLHLIDDILDFSKIEASKLELECTNVSISDIADLVYSSLIPAAISSKVDLSVFVVPCMPRKIWSDSTRLRQILYNLIGNAIKFSGGQQQRGRVTVRLEYADGESKQLIIKVFDNGIGVSKINLPSLFNSFSQAEVSTTRRFGGSGLGLAITDRIVKLMGGTIEVQSNPGIETCFSVTIPLNVVKGSEQGILKNLSGIECILVSDVNSCIDNMQDINSYLQYTGANSYIVNSLSDAARLASKISNPIVISSAIPRKTGDSIAELHAKFSDVTNVHHILITDGRHRNSSFGGPGILVIDRTVSRMKTLLGMISSTAGREPHKALDKVLEDKLISRGTVPPSVADARAADELILIAEDDSTNQKVIVRQLALLGYAAEVANDGKEALELLHAGKYALLLTDLHMPNIDGYKLTEIIRQEEGELHMPILALTANALSGAAKIGIDIGMDGYLTKPLQLRQLSIALQRWMPVKKGSAMVENINVEPGQSPNQLVDMTILKSLIGDNQDDLREIFTDFHLSLEEISMDLREAFDVGDLEQVGFSAHKLKSSSRAIGAVEFGDFCAEIENSIRVVKYIALAAYMTEFDRAVKGLSSAVSAILKKEII